MVADVCVVVTYGWFAGCDRKHCPRRTTAVARATGTTTASHDEYNDSEKHRADYSSSHNTSGPNS